MSLRFHKAISLDGTNMSGGSGGGTNYEAGTGIEIEDKIISVDFDEVATAAQGAKADTAVQPEDLADVATSGDYNDLDNLPTIPTVNNGTLTVETSDGTSLGTFTANSSTNTTITLPAQTTVNDATLTITQNDTSVGTFTANSSTNTTIDIDAYTTDEVDTLLDEKQDVLDAEEPLNIDYVEHNNMVGMTIDNENNTIYSTIQKGLAGNDGNTALVAYLPFRSTDGDYINEHFWDAGYIETPYSLGQVICSGSSIEGVIQANYDNLCHIVFGKYVDDNFVPIVGKGNYYVYIYHGDSYTCSFGYNTIDGGAAYNMTMTGTYSNTGSYTSQTRISLPEYNRPYGQAAQIVIDNSTAKFVFANNMYVRVYSSSDTDVISRLYEITTARIYPQDNAGHTVDEPLSLSGLGLYDATNQLTATDLVTENALGTNLFDINGVTKTTSLSLSIGTGLTVDDGDLVVDDSVVAMQTDLPSVFTGADGTNAGTSGLVPAPAASDNTKFLCGDGTFATPTNTTYSDFTGATASTAGASGLVPAPAAGDESKVLQGDGTWVAQQTVDQTYDSTSTNAQSGVAIAGELTSNYVDLTSNQTIAGYKSFSEYITLSRTGVALKLGNSVSLDSTTRYRNITAPMVDSTAGGGTSLGGVLSVKTAGDGVSTFNTDLFVGDSTYAKLTLKSNDDIDVIRGSNTYTNIDSGNISSYVSGVQGTGISAIVSLTQTEYDEIGALYSWGDAYHFTRSETPSAGDSLYTASGQVRTGEQVDAYDSTNDTITVNGGTLNRNSADDTTCTDFYDATTLYVITNVVS